MRQPRTPSCSAGSARVCTPALSDPMSGSVTDTATIVSPEAKRGSQYDFCSSVPPASNAFERISGRVASEPAAASEATESSSVMMIIGRSPIPVPPNSSGIEEPKKPCSENLRINSSGTSRSWRWMSCAIGTTSFLPKSRARSRVSEAISSSSSTLLTPPFSMRARPISRSRDSARPERTASRTAPARSPSASAPTPNSSYAASMAASSACVASAA